MSIKLIKLVCCLFHFIVKSGSIIEAPYFATTLYDMLLVTCQTSLFSSLITEPYCDSSFVLWSHWLVMNCPKLVVGYWYGPVSRFFVPPSHPWSLTCMFYSVRERTFCLSPVFIKNFYWIIQFLFSGLLLGVF